MLFFLGNHDKFTNCEHNSKYEKQKCIKAFGFKSGASLRLRRVFLKSLGPERQFIRRQQKTYLLIIDLVDKTTHVSYQNYASAEIIKIVINFN